ncbi:MAG TPA: efflux RND transporter periplasmic adaptor subunit [Deltaproteobacteria bacterium]|nr:efflux RND transporter periplasmic adaptor subunit [Deltaproteobacteria bacterium]
MAATLLLLPTVLHGAESFEVRALLVPQREAVLSSQIHGRIIELPVEVGDRFAQGQLLVALDCEVLAAELQKAKMDLEAATETHAAMLRLLEFGSVSELEVAVASAKKKRAQAEVLLGETKVSMCRIHAPFAGRVVKRPVNPYENVTPENPVLEIIADSKLKLHLLVPSHWLQWLAAGQQFKVRLDETGKSYQAVVTGLGARVNPVNQTLELEAAFSEKHDELLAGMSGTAVLFKPAKKDKGN